MMMMMMMMMIIYRNDPRDLNVTLKFLVSEAIKQLEH